MDGWRDQRSELRAEPFIPALSEIGTSRPRYSRADFRFDHRPQDSWYRAKIRACGNVEKVRRDRQAAGDTPPEKTGARGPPVSAGPQLSPFGTSPDTGELARLPHKARSRVPLPCPPVVGLQPVYR